MPACKLIWINWAGSSNLNVMVSCSANLWIDVMTDDYELYSWDSSEVYHDFCKSILTTTYKPRCDECVDYSPTSNGEKRPLLYSHPTKYSNLSSKYIIPNIMNYMMFFQQQVVFSYNLQVIHRIRF